MELLSTSVCKILVVFAFVLSISTAIRLVELTPKQLELQKTRNQTVSNRVIGGIDATPGLAPYQISLQTYYKSHMCGGAIIDDRHIVTAAHCVDGQNQKDLRVATGSIRWNEPDRIYLVETYFLHCNYDIPEYHNDIAILRLTESIEWNEYTQPIELPTEPMKHLDDVLLTGWGSTELWGQTPAVLQQLPLKYYDYPNCQKMLGNDQRNGVGHVCTYTKEGEGACHGDSGGPIVSGGKLVGVVNWGVPCAQGAPDSYAGVFYYLDWISTTLSSTCKKCYCLPSYW